MNRVYNKPKIVAEIGACHLGNIDRAMELCKLAKICGADYVKSQKRNPDESTPEHMKSKPHPNKIFSYGETYLEHRKNLELSIDQHADIKTYCEDIGIGYSTSVWDVTSAREIIRLNPDFIKVPSACNMHKEMLDVLRNEYSGDIHLSTGMTTKEEIHELVDWAKPIGNRIVLYHCTSKYPCAFEDLHLLEIERLQPLTRHGIDIGFSNHGRGIAADIASFALGVSWVERHFIDDRTTRHTDAAASLEPPGLQKLCRDLKAVSEAMCARPQRMDDEELEQRNKLKFSGEGYGDEQSSGKDE